MESVVAEQFIELNLRFNMFSPMCIKFKVSLSFTHTKIHKALWANLKDTVRPMNKIMSHY